MYNYITNRNSPNFTKGRTAKISTIGAAITIFVFMVLAMYGLDKFFK